MSSLVATTVAAGRSVELALFFDALTAWTEEAWDRADDVGRFDSRRLAELDRPPLTEMLRDARDTGGLRLFACSASARFQELEMERVQSRVDAVVGWQTLAERVAAAGRVVTL